MPVPQITPPGFLDQHSLLVALSPALLAIGTGFAAWMIAGTNTKRPVPALRWIAGFSLIGALVIQALFLLPGGAAVAFAGEPLAHGLVRVGVAPTAAGLLLALWAFWQWRPRDAVARVWPWCLRVALAAALPVVALPLLVLGCEGDVAPVATINALVDSTLVPAWWRRRLLRVVLALVFTVLAVAVPFSGLPAALSWCLTVVVLLVTALTAPGPWRWPLVAAALALGIP